MLFAKRFNDTIAAAAGGVVAGDSGASAGAAAGGFGEKVVGDVMSGQSVMDAMKNNKPSG